jgi:hypothetical protein
MQLLSTGESDQDGGQPLERLRRWHRSRSLHDGDDSILQLETRLKAVDRYFNLRNHPTRSDGPISLHHDLYHELQVVLRQLQYLIRLIESILDSPDANALVFRHYLEAQWMSDDRRDSILRHHRDQEHPEESLYSLLIGLHSLAQLTGDALGTDTVQLATYRAFADQYRSLIVHNRFFGPLANHPLYPTSGWTSHPVVQQSIRHAPSQRLRRSLGFTMLVLGRYLTILGWITPDSEDRDLMLESMPLFALLRSEFRSLRVYLEQSLRRRFFPDGTRVEAEREILTCVDAMAFQLAAEEERAFDKFLLDYAGTTSSREFAGRVEAVKQLLTVFFEGATVVLLKIVAPNVVAGEIFPDMVERFEQSARLREDLWIFGRVLEHVIDRVGQQENTPEERRRAFDCLLEFVSHFEEESFKGIRNTEYDSFDSFLTETRAMNEEAFEDTARNQDIISNFECFRIFVEMVRGHVSQRVELQETSLDVDHSHEILDGFLGEA